jgi:dissimilatory sulfite reductase (desulfoviridin) alpha/beta subunit
MEEIMSGFVRIDQREIIEKYLTIEFFNALEKVSKENDQKYVTAFVRTFTPDYFTSEEILKKIIDKAEELKQYDITRRGLLESVDVMNRRLQSYKLTYNFLKKNN